MPRQFNPPTSSTAEVKTRKDQVKEKIVVEEVDLLKLVNTDTPFNKVLRSQIESMQKSGLENWDLFDHVYKTMTNIRSALLNAKLPKAKLSLMRRDELVLLLNKIEEYYEYNRTRYNDSLKSGTVLPPNNEGLLKIVATLHAFDTTLLKREHPDNDEVAERKYREQQEEISKTETNVREESFKVKAQQKIVPSFQEYADPVQRENILIPKNKADAVLSAACIIQNEEFPTTTADKIRVLINELYTIGRGREAESGHIDPKVFSEAGVRIETEIIPAIVRIVAEDPKMFMDESVQTALKILEQGIRDPYVRALNKHSEKVWVAWSDTADAVGGGGKLKNALIQYENKLQKEMEAKMAVELPVQTDQTSDAQKPKDVSFLFRKVINKETGKVDEGTPDKPESKFKH